MNDRGHSVGEGARELAGAAGLPVSLDGVLSSIGPLSALAHTA